MVQVFFGQYEPLLATPPLPKKYPSLFGRYCSIIITNVIHIQLSMASKSNFSHLCQSGWPRPTSLTPWESSTPKPVFLVSHSTLPSLGSLTAAVRWKPRPQERGMYSVADREFLCSGGGSRWKRNTPLTLVRTAQWMWLEQKPGPVEAPGTIKEIPLWLARDQTGPGTNKEIPLWRCQMRAPNLCANLFLTHSA